MATTESTKQALQAKEPAKDLRTLIREATNELSLALPEHMRPERLVRIALTLIRQTPKLADCTPESFLGALFTAAQLGIEPIAGRAYLLPFYNSKKRANPKPGESEWHKVLEAQFVMGYKGMAELFYRHEKSLLLSWGVVKEHDEFDYELGTESFLRHKPAKGDRGGAIGFYVVATLEKAKTFHYMSSEEVFAHGRQHSKTFDKKKQDFYDDSPWKTNPEAMCLKTTLLQLGKVLPLSFELQRAIEQDETSREYKTGIKDMLEAPSTTNWNDPPMIEQKPKQADPNDGGEPPAESGKKAEEEIPFGD